ncbi:hypothetical protein EA473_14015 [Natrarchaeobius chitinivorans]|uniref:Uncharacterized protein n=1 Tax=Natrarchaeobius chitinivorans TaxID=1679083 RepID=A0A3N6P6A2_NATCH|nr:hypothetical protein EA473_14015 [Natrarchaeobius chitinivorans]
MIRVPDGYVASVFFVMVGARWFAVVEHLSNVELDPAIEVAQKADETRFIRRLCFVKYFITKRWGLVG